MKTLIFGGSSDDTFGEITPRGDDFDNCANGKPIEWLIESASEDNRLIVVGQYAPGNASGWVVGVAPHDPTYNDKPIPDWPIRLRAPRPNLAGIYQSERPYSPILEIDVPDDATLRCLQRGPDAED